MVLGKVCSTTSRKMTAHESPQLLNMLFGLHTHGNGGGDGDYTITDHFPDVLAGVLLSRVRRVFFLYNTFYPKDLLSYCMFLRF